MKPRSIELGLGLLCGLLLAGCNSVTGKVDGQAVQACSSFFVQEADVWEDVADEEDDPAEDDALTIFISSMPNACRKVEDLSDALDDADSPEEAADAWRTLARKQFWEIRIFIRTDAAGVDLGDMALEGVAWDRLLEESNQTYATIYHYKEWLDEAYWELEEDPEDHYRDFWYSEQGELEIGSHTPGDRITGSFTTAAADPYDGAEAGDITINFDSYRCLGAERELY